MRAICFSHDEERCAILQDGAHIVQIKLVGKHQIVKSVMLDPRLLRQECQMTFSLHKKFLIVYGKTLFGCYDIKTGRRLNFYHAPFGMEICKVKVVGQCGETYVWLKTSDGTRTLYLAELEYVRGPGEQQQQ